jgi:hypothetical protein
MIWARMIAFKNGAVDSSHCEGQQQSITLRVISVRNWQRIFILAAIMLSTLLFSSLSAFAQGGPPMQTDDPGTPGNNNWEINVANTMERSKAENVYGAPILDINYGVGPRIQLKYQVSYLLQSNNDGPLESGLGKSLAGVKWRFYQSAKYQLNISTYPQLEFNNPTDSVKRGLADPGTRFLLPFEITKNVKGVELNLELGTWFSGQGTDGHLVGFAIGHQFTRSLELLAEVYKLTDKTPGTEFTTDYGFGGRYTLHKGVLFIFEGGHGFSGPPGQQPRFVGYFGLQFQIDHGKPQD